MQILVLTVWSKLVTLLSPQKSLPTTQSQNTPCNSKDIYSQGDTQNIHDGGGGGEESNIFFWFENLDAQSFLGVKGLVTYFFRS